MSWLARRRAGRDDRVAAFAPPAPVAALDVGSSKVVCLIAYGDEDGALETLALAHRPSRGVVNGAVVDIAAAADVLHAVVEDAQAQAGVAVNRVTVGFSAGRLTSTRVRGRAGLNDRPVEDRDLRRALDNALRGCAAPGRVLVHALPVAWAVDGHRGAPDPRGLFGLELEAELHTISARAGPVRNLTLAVERAGLELRAVVAAPYASGLSCLIEDEAALGATVIDLGAGVTAAAVFAEGALAHVHVTPLGGERITADLARGLGVSLADAEDLKRQRGAVSSEAGQDRSVAPFTPLGASSAIGRAPIGDIARYLRPRVEEIFELVRDGLAKAPDYAAGGRVALTGGGALLTGVAEVARDIFAREVRIARPAQALRPNGAGPAVSEPALATVVGLARHALSAPKEALAGPPQTAKALAQAAGARTLRAPGRPAAAVVRAAAWLRENF